MQRLERHSIVPRLLKINGADFSQKMKIGLSGISIKAKKLRADANSVRIHTTASTPAFSID
jgi:hypothetical protein